MSIPLERRARGIPEIIETESPPPLLPSLEEMPAWQYPNSCSNPSMPTTEKKKKNERLKNCPGHRLSYCHCVVMSVVCR